MNRRGFISMMGGAAGAVLVPWRLPDPIIFLPARSRLELVSGIELLQLMENTYRNALPGLVSNVTRNNLFLKYLTDGVNNPIRINQDAVLVRAERLDLLRSDKLALDLT